MTKADENRVRRHAQAAGYILQRNPRRTPSAPDWGLYRLSRPGGATKAPYTLTLAQAEASLHSLPSKLPPVLDPASGSRMNYFDRSDPRVLFGDIRREEVQLPDRILRIDPDQLMDFRALPFADESFHLVQFDPPHLTRAGASSWLAAKYGTLDPDTWAKDLSAGFAEAFRVLKPHGVLVFRWSEDQIPLPDVLALTPYLPIFGHRSGRRFRSHWVTFMKA